MNSKFQSLLGFLMRCDLTPISRSGSGGILFQSLLGFLMRCDKSRCALFRDSSLVSIPDGFSYALRPFRSHSADVAIKVSIPTGFSDVLRYQRKRERCHYFLVSIPTGFSDALRRDHA